MLANAFENTFTYLLTYYTYLLAYLLVTYVTYFILTYFTVLTLVDSTYYVVLYKARGSSVWFPRWVSPQVLLSFNTPITGETFDRTLYTY